MPNLTRRHVLAGAAATAAVAAMPAASAIAAVEEAPDMLLGMFPATEWRRLSNAELLALLDEPPWARMPAEISILMNMRTRGPDDYDLEDLDDDGKRIR